MRYALKYSSRFNKSYKRVKQYPGFSQAKLNRVVDTLLAGEKLPDQYRDHALSGLFAGLRECHLAPDILLVYSIQDSILTLTLIDIGKHSQLFR